MPTEPSAPPIAVLTRQRSLGERVLIWLLRRWWALAVIVIGGALTSQFGQVVQSIFSELLRGQAPSFNTIGTSWSQTVASVNPTRAAIIFSGAILITIAAYLAERAESAREQRQAAEDTAARQAHEKTERRDEMHAIVAQFLSEKAQQGLNAEGEEEEEAASDSGVRQVALPPRPALVLGREADLARIAAAIAAPGVTAVSLRGMGGVGKSTLLNETLHRQAGAGTFSDGVIWLNGQDLAAQDGEAQVYEAAASALGRSEVTKVSGLAAKAAALRKALAGKRLLIGLDNVEQHLPLANVVKTLTARDAGDIGPVVLMTTRYSFSGELSALREIDLEVLDIDTGLDLLRALLDRAGRPLAVEDASVARAIVEAIGALPLAIELVAPRIARRAEPIAALATRLRSDGGVQLRTSSRGIERTFDDTYSQLNPDQQQAFSALTVFSGPDFSQEAALVAIHAALGHDADPQLLLDLSDLSLLRELPQAEGPPRYQLHPLLRQFARERLRERGPEIMYRVELAAARHYRSVAQHASARRGGYSQPALEREYANIAGALTWAHEQMLRDPQGEQGREGMQLVGDLCGALRFYLSDQGYWTDARRFLEWGIAADRQLGNHRREATLLVAVAFIIRQQGDLDTAERYYGAALNLSRAHGERQAEAARLQNLGTVALMRQQYDRARTLYEESLALRRKLGDKGGTSSVLRALGTLAAEQGQLEEARQYLREALDLFQGRSRDLAFSRTLRELAAVYIRDPQGDHARARQILEEALETQRRRNQLYDIAQTLEWLGTLEVLEQHPLEARAHWEEALAIYQRLGSNAAIQVRERLARLLGAREAVASH